MSWAGGTALRRSAWLMAVLTASWLLPQDEAAGASGPGPACLVVTCLGGDPAPPEQSPPQGGPPAVQPPRDGLPGMELPGAEPDGPAPAAPAQPGAQGPAP